VDINDNRKNNLPNIELPLDRKCCVTSFLLSFLIIYGCSYFFLAVLLNMKPLLVNMKLGSVVVGPSRLS
jgi:hypothetical protein